MDGVKQSLQQVSSSTEETRREQGDVIKTNKKKCSLSLNKKENKVNGIPQVNFNSTTSVKKQDDAFTKLLNREVKYLSTVNRLNPYNRLLLQSVEQDKENINMSAKKNNKIRKNKNTQTDKFQQRSILSYFNNTNENSVNILKSSKRQTNCDKIIDLCENSSSPREEIIQSGVVDSSQNSSIKIPHDYSLAVSKKAIAHAPCTNSFKILNEFDVKGTNAAESPTPSSNGTDHSFTRLFSGKRTKKLKECPPYKLVKGTPFAVDAFSYGDIPGVEAYFLTHFHSDHYMGLRKSFNKPLYCTEITSKLCQQKLGLNISCITILEVDKTIDVCGVQVAVVDANHCPGSVMLVFSLPSGKNVLHCGDFRASDLMESYPIFWNREIHTVHLDTTYCSPQYDFPTQSESISEAISILQRKRNAMESNGDSFDKLLIICGTYTIGKEKFFTGIAEQLKFNIWAPSEKNAILNVALGQDFNSKPKEKCQLHVLPMGKLQYNILSEYLSGMGDQFTEILAFKPSGWELSKNSLIQRGNITIHGIPYSEHSSFTELQRFIKFLRPQHIIPTVPAHGGSKAMQKYFSCWVGETDQKAQRKLSDFFVSKGTKL